MSNVWSGFVKLQLKSSRHTFNSFKKKRDFNTSSIKVKKYGLGKYIIYFYDLIEMKIVAFRYDCCLKGFACPTILIEF